MTWDWVKRSNAYLTSDTWPAVRFQPMLYLFIWGATIRLALNKSEPPRFDVIAHDFYVVWLTLGIVGPMLELLAWWLIQKRAGRWRFMGMWLRLSADIQVATVMVSYHLVGVLDRNPSEAKIFARYMSSVAMLFVVVLVVRDIWTLVLTERMAGRIHREGQR